MTRLPTRPPRQLARAVRPRAPGPDPAALAAVVTRAWLEIRARRRPLSQLAPLTTPAVLSRLRDEVRRTSGPTDVPRIRRVVATSPQEDACEACVTVEHPDGRVSAFAVRLERHLGAWRVADLAAPESGLHPLPTASLPEGYVRRDAFDEAEEEAEGIR